MEEESKRGEEKEETGRGEGQEEPGRRAEKRVEEETGKWGVGEENVGRESGKGGIESGEFE